MSTPRANVDDAVIDEFDFNQATPSPFRDRARQGMRFHVLTGGADLPIFHVTARRRGRGWWIDIDEIDGSGRPVRWSSLESTARRAITRSLGIAPSDFDLVIDLPPMT